MNPPLSQELSELRVLVTRPIHQAQALADALDRRGAHSLQLPTIKVSPTEGTPRDEALEMLRGLDEKRYDATLLTSANATAALIEAMRHSGAGVAPVNHTTIFVVGPATAAFAKECGFAPLVLSEEFTGEGVLQRVLTHYGHELSQHRFLFPRALRGRDHLVKGLREAGAQVDVATLYETTPIQEGPALPSQLHWITFTSPSAVQGFFNVYSLPHGTSIACIGPVTAQELERQGIQPEVVAKEHTITGLVEGIVNQVQKSAT